MCSPRDCLMVLEVTENDTKKALGKARKSGAEGESVII